jgi:hypothetical protein
MKTIYTTLQTIFTSHIAAPMRLATVAAGMMVCTFGFSQYTSRVWVTVNDPAILDVSKETPFSQLMQAQSVGVITRAFPNAHTPSLQNVYELGCNCDNTILEQQLTRIEGVSTPVAVYDAVTLNVPDDYNVAFATDYALDLIHAQGAWQYTHGNPNLMLAITDTDFDITHEELAGKILAGGTTGSSSYYHGTAVAITAAGKTNNGVGKSSIGYDCGVGLFLCNYNALLVARDNGARVVNASWHDGSCAPNPYCQSIIDELYNDGVVVVAAAGNGNTTCGSSSALAYPAAYNHVISVTSVGPNDNHERFAGDPASTHQHNAMVDISAPGYDVPLSVAAGWYLTGNGSSFAAPFVTGTIGLMLSANPNLTVDQIENILETSSDNIDALNPGYAGLIGAGRLNAERALALCTTLPRPHNGEAVESPVFEGTIGGDENIAGDDELVHVQPVIYPNPSKGNITIAYPFQSGQSVEIIDLTGRTEQVIAVDTQDKMNLSEQLDPGVYHIVLKEKGRVMFQEKVIVL